MIPGESWWSGNGHECRVIVKQSSLFVLPHVFVAIPDLPWEIEDSRNLPSMRIQYEYFKMKYLKMSYGYTAGLVYV